MKDTTQRPEETIASYTVGALPEADRPATRYALFFTHGMGQPIPFETMDQVATSLHERDIEEGNENPRPNAVTVKVGDDWLSRIELRLKAGDDAVEVHLYEGYWAPMTEGRITVGNVMGFLAGAGFNALRHTAGEFKRWMFKQYPPVAIPVRTVFFLLTALATIASLVVMNSTIAIIAAARALLGQRPGWLSDNLFIDLTTTFNVVVAAMGLFGASLVAAVLMRRHPALAAVRKAWGPVTVALFVVTLFIVIVAGLSIPFLFYGHVRGLTGLVPIWYSVDPAVAATFNHIFERVASRIGLLVAAFVAGRWIGRIINGLRHDLADKKTSRSTLVVAAGFLVLAAALIALTVFFLKTFAANSPDGALFAQRAVAWPLLVAASAYVRLVLVQYVGDVAIYVMPYKLDAFTTLRREIKQRVYEAAKAVYSQDEYASVIVIGHSLGSVIAYDALNMLILEDISWKEAEKSKKKTDKPKEPDPKDSKKATKKFLNVVERTPLFLTFGSPLDKTAFVFAVQARGTSEAREALAGSVQPLIQDYRYRPKRWVNIWSPWDIISGPLDLYDYPDPPPRLPTHSQRVDNVPDEEATTLLIAHTEYWENTVLVETIYDAIEALDPARRRSARASARRQ